MLRKPGSRYEVGRSSSLLKVKTFHDTEARVIGHAPGAGRHKGRLGALIVEMQDGTKFNVGTGFSDNERENPPKVGAIITFRYQELTKDGVPRFPSYVGERIDISWPTAKPKKSRGRSSPATRPEPLPADPAAFWGGGEVPPPPEVRAPEQAAALLRRLGPFSFWRGRTPMTAELDPLYERAAAKALDVFVGGSK